MTRESITMSRPSLPGHPSVAAGSKPESERGQMLVIFALALVALIGMVGLIVDGGDTFLQRRDQQNVADAAAMAAGYASANGQDGTAVTDAARDVAAANGYVNGEGGTTVTVANPSNGISVDFPAGGIRVIVSRPHRNYFAGAMGFASWDVSTTASVQAGIPNGAIGVMPIIFHRSAFEVSGNRSAATPATFVLPPPGLQDAPEIDTEFSWTIFCTANGNHNCNGNAEGIRDYIDNDGTSTVIATGDEIGPLNSGDMTTLFDGLSDHVGESFPVAIVDGDSGVTGWAYFTLTGSVGGSTKSISGWFGDPIAGDKMVITQGAGPAGKAYGAYVVKLTN
jgi:hypothetical protein